MYCILVTGIPAAGKSSMARKLAAHYQIPMISKDDIKEILFDNLGFRSREEKVKEGIAAMHIMYYMAEQMMKVKKPFILENNFEFISKEELIKLLNEYEYQAITVTLTGDYPTIYHRFLKRNESPTRHRGHVVNDCYPEKESGHKAAVLSYEDFVSGIQKRGMDQFVANGPQIIIDTTDFDKLDLDKSLNEINQLINAFTTEKSV